MRGRTREWGREEGGSCEMGPESMRGAAAPAGGARGAAERWGVALEPCDAGTARVPYHTMMQATSVLPRAPIRPGRHGRGGGRGVNVRARGGVGARAVRARGTAHRPHTRIRGSEE